ncbi:MAG: hypothetical protein FWG03_08415 [Clostridiales bacterium]|nr:hypothetical protein [Clostridiales bacterium]
MRKSRALPNPSGAYKKGASYVLRLKFDIGDGNFLTSGNLTIKPAQSKVKHSLPRRTFYQSRTGVGYKEIVDLAAVKPAGAKIVSVAFNPAKPKNNPGDAYWY